MNELAPLDVLGRKFSRRVNGYSPVEVHELLSEVASSLEVLARDRGELKQRVARLETELEQFRQREDALHEALVAAQRSADQTVDGARRDAEEIVREGHLLADRLVEEASGRARNVERAIASLRNNRREVRADLMRMVEILQGVVQDDQRKEAEERETPQLALLRQRHRQAGETS